MGMTKVWNVSDDPNTSVHPRSVMVLGKSLAPGRSLSVDESTLKTAHKLLKAAESKVVFIGKQPPASYLKAKNPPRAKLADGVLRTHGVVAPSEAQAAIDEGAKKITLELKDSLSVADEARVSLDSSDDGTEETYGSRKRRGHRG